MGRTLATGGRLTVAFWETLDPIPADAAEAAPLDLLSAGRLLPERPDHGRGEVENTLGGWVTASGNLEFGVLAQLVTGSGHGRQGLTAL